MITSIFCSGSKRDMQTHLSGSPHGS